MSDCTHYYGNTGDGWMTCVKCGAAPPKDWPNVKPESGFDVSKRAFERLREACSEIWDTGEINRDTINQNRIARGEAPIQWKEP